MADVQKTRLEVFVSYAKEDFPLVRDIIYELREAFGVLLDISYDKETIRQGAEWRTEINQHLDSADVLLIVATGQRKESHSFTGFEVGYFARSIQGRALPDGTGRRIIPLIIGGPIPSSLLDIQGVYIQPDDYLIFDVGQGNMSNEDKFMELCQRSDDPFMRMLMQLRDNVTQVSSIKLTSDELRALDKRIGECAGRIYRKFFIYLRGRVYREVYPERKLIIRTATPPGSTDEEVMLNKSTIELVGDSFEMFGFRDRPANLPWQSFISAISPRDLATQWQDAIRTLVSDAFNGIPVENYSFVRSPQTGRSFRLFVSLVRTYYSEQQEVHIYIVEVAPPNEYGDTLTTKLAKAVDLGLRYRSLFLEDRSPFAPQTIGLLFSADKLRTAVKDMWRELQHLLTEMKQANLDDPELLIAIYGHDGHEDLDELARVWGQAEANLSSLIHDVMAVSDDKIMEMKPKIKAALSDFCNKTEQMNQEYTAKALRALEGAITLNVAKTTQASAAAR